MRHFQSSQAPLGVGTLTALIVQKRKRKLREVKQISPDTAERRPRQSASRYLPAKGSRKRSNSGGKWGQEKIVL